MKVLFNLLFTLLITNVLCAQKIECQFIHNKDNTLSIFGTGYNHGNVSYEFHFLNMENCMVESRVVASIYGEGEIVRLYPKNRLIPIYYGRCNWHAQMGRLNAHPNTKIVYRLPFAKKALTLGALQGKVKEIAVQDSVAEYKASVCFELKRGDTVVAMRKGRVVKINNEYPLPADYRETTDVNNIYIEHSDGTIAVYEILQQNSFMVKEGDDVLPGTPLALVGANSATNFRVKVRVYSVVASNRYGGSERLLKNRYLIPRFATQRGVEAIYEQRYYRPVCTEDMITAEMSRKEKKQYLSTKNAAVSEKK